MFQHINDNNTHPKSRLCYPDLKNKVHTMNGIANKAVQDCYRIIEHLQETHRSVTEAPSKHGQLCKKITVAEMKISKIEKLSEQLNQLIAIYEEKSN